MRNYEKNPLTDSEKKKLKPKSYSVLKAFREASPFDPEDQKVFDRLEKQRAEKKNDKK